MIFGKGRANSSTKRYSEYDNSDKWTLLDNFNILEEERPDGGRPFARKCLPKQISVTLANVQLVNDLDWRHRWGTAEPDSPRGYAPRQRITFNGTIEDRITVFSMEHGAIETFSEFKDGAIYPIGAGQEIGGTRNATSADGIYNSSGRDPKVPPGGLMESEPGRLNHFPEEHSLLLGLFLDQASFDRLALAISRAGSIHMALLAELFEGEVSAALKDGGRAEYGLLLGERNGSAKARIDSITVFDAKQELVDYETGRKVVSDDDDSDDDLEKDIPLERRLASLERHLQHILWALFTIVVLLALIVYGR